MRRDGAVRRARGRRGGTFVLGREPAPAPPSGSFESLFSMRHVRRVEIIAHDRRRGSEEICAALGLASDSLVAYNERRLVGADGPIAPLPAFMPPQGGARRGRRHPPRRLLPDIL